MIEVLQTCIHTLHELCDSQDLTEHNEKKCKDALETIQDYVDNLDTANGKNILNNQRFIKCAIIETLTHIHTMLRFQISSLPWHL